MGGGLFLQDEIRQRERAHPGAAPVLFSDTPLPEYNRGPYLGEQTERILLGLGYSKAQIADMFEANAVAHPEPRAN